MQCPRCRHEAPASARFCGECAAPLGRTCPSCRALNPPANAYCIDCGTSLGEAGAGRTAQDPHEYTPKYLAEKIIRTREALEGERKQVTVLFADLRGSLEILADRDPEDARRILDPVLTLMMEAVHRYEGTVNQVMGDGIMALFGAPLAHEDHAVRACYAALRMQESITRLADDLRRLHGLSVQIRVGLNSGEVVVRSVGSDLRMDYTAVGQSTHLAARMEQLAKIQDQDDQREIREKVTGRLLTLDESLKPTLPALLALLDVPVDDPSWRALDPGQRRQFDQKYQRWKSGRPQ